MAEAVSGAGGAGRRRRDPEWTHWVLVDSLLQLVGEDGEVPTRRQIAERAGVSERTVFVHFADRESLYETAALRQAERWQSLAEPVPSEWPTGRRVDALLRQRERMYALMAPIRRIGLGLEPRSPALHRVMLDGDRWLRADLAGVLAPELSRVAGADTPGGLLDSLDAATSWEAWEHLRERRGLGPDEARRAVTRTLLALLR